MKALLLSTLSILALGLTAPAHAEEHGTKAAAPAAMETPAVGTVAEVAAGNPDFSTLVSALTAADWVEGLKGTGPFTVFAPTNEAFAKIPADALADLMKPENKAKLQAVLTYHVVPGKIAAADAKGTAVELKTVQGGIVKVDGTGEMVKIGEATVTATDIPASNGVIHVIDTVLMPPEAPTEAAPAAGDVAQ